MSNDRKRLVDAREVGLGVFDEATELLEGLAVGVDDARDLRLERKAAQIREPRDAHALEGTGERRAEARRVLVDREWIGGERSGDRAQEEGDVADRARDRSARRER